MKVYKMWMMMILLALGSVSFMSCNTSKGMPKLDNTEGHDAKMGGGTGSGTIGDDPTEPGAAAP